MTGRRRIDQILVERGLAETRQKAQALLLAGKVLVGNQKIDKPGRLVDALAEIRLLGELPFVSRAGGKLEAALEHFQICVRGRICADLGASTGGFTDCLLQRGAAGVHAFDVGRGQLAWKLRTDPRVVVHDNFNVRNLSAADLPAGVSLLTVDLSFISVTKILAPVRDAVLARNRSWSERAAGFIVDFVVLVKPQFEAGKGEVGKGGIVRDPAQQLEAVHSVSGIACQAGFHSIGFIPSPIAGAKGNREFLLYLQLPDDL
jgi:23S rRNA (cytidine1920-2'-O)/16S rRNA (cytidine1409-2'-O)-methyltransferase